MDCHRNNLQSPPRANLLPLFRGRGFRRLPSGPQATPNGLLLVRFRHRRPRPDFADRSAARPARGGAADTPGSAGPGCDPRGGAGAAEGRGPPEPSMEVAASAPPAPSSQGRRRARPGYSRHQSRACRQSRAVPRSPPEPVAHLGVRVHAVLRPRALVLGSVSRAVPRSPRVRHTQHQR